MKTKIKFLATMLMGIMLSTNVWGETYTLVTDASSLKAGDQICFVSTGTYRYSSVDYNFTAANIGKATYSKKDYLGSVDVTISDNTVTNTDIQPITLGGTSGAWTLWTSDGYISNGGGNTLKFDNTNGQTFSIAIGNDAPYNATIKSTTNSDSILCYNPNNGSNARFTIYGSTQKPIMIYKCTSCVSCTVDLATPVVMATAGNGSATLTWAAVEHATNYTVTCVGAIIGSITGEGTKTCTLTGLTNGTQYTWKVKAIGGDEYCDSKEASGNVTPSANHTVTWYVDGFEYTTGDPTTEVVHGGKVATLPTQPAVPTACAGSVFVGWTDRAVTNGNKPSPLFKDAASAPTVNANVNYHAVFADPE